VIDILNNSEEINQEPQN